MKKVVSFIILLFCMSAAFADVRCDYTPWKEACKQYEENVDFISKKNEYQEQYETVIREILPFFETMDADAGVELYFGMYTDDNWNSVFTPFLDCYLDDFWLTFRNMHLESDGLHGEVDLCNWTDDMVADIYLSYDDFLMKSDGSFVTGPSREEGAWYACDDGLCQFMLYDSRLEKTPDGYVLVCNDLEYISSNAFTYPDADSDCIKVGSATFDMDGNVLSYKPCDEKHAYDICGTICKTTHVTWKDDVLLLEGEYEFPELKLAGSSKQMYLQIEDEVVIIDEPDKLFSFSFKGFNFRGKGLRTYVDGPSYDRQACLDIGEAELLLGGDTTYVGAMTLVYDYAGFQVKGNPGFYGPVKTFVFGPYDYLVDLRFTDEGLQGILYGGCPEPFTGGVEYGLVVLNPDGSVDYDSSSMYGWNSYSLRFGSYSFSGPYFSQDEIGFYVDEARLGLPVNCVVSGLSLDGGVWIKYDGTAEIYGAGYPFNGPGKFCDMVFSPDQMLFQTDGLRFTGTYYLPDSLPGTLSGKSMGLTLDLNLDGSIKSLKSDFGGAYQISIPDFNFNLSFSGAYVEVEQRVNKSGLQPYEARLILKQPQLIVMSGGKPLSAQMRDIFSKATVAFNMDGTLSYRLPDAASWQLLNLHSEN